jgi:4-hydroxy-3-methylbut-2-enyl diphosphate reductase
MDSSTPPLALLLCAPRGFCAGVERAIAMVEAALAKHGAPVFVRHEIVHNRAVVARLKGLGAVFVEELGQIPDAARPVIFSAHGVSKAVAAEAAQRGFSVIDATCPLVSKAHHEAALLHRQGHHILMVGHAGHPEVLGTLGQVPPAAATLVENLAQAESVAPPAGPLALVTQTTLSVDDTRQIITCLLRRFPHLRQPHKEDICYATTNRQAAVKAAAPRCARFIVVGAPNSSNSLRLVEAARAAGCADAVLVERPDDLAGLDWGAFGGASLGLTAGASAPESLVRGVIGWLAARFALTTEDVVTATEDVTFKIPQSLAS